MLRVSLPIAAALGCFCFIVLALPAVQPDKLPESGKGKDDAAKSKSQPLEKPEPKDTGKPKTPLDKLKLPKDAVIIVVDDLLNAPALFPKFAVMSWEEYFALKDRLKTLEGATKAERKTPGLCKLHGRLDGDFVVFRAEFVFSTEEPKTTVFLGLRGAFLSDEGSLNGKTPILEPGDDGLLLRVDKEAAEHRLTLNFRVPAQTKKTAWGVVERGIKLDLPGSSATPLHLELPSTVKELIWNDTLERTKTPGSWNIGLGTAKVVALSWKEPAGLTGAAPLPKAEGKIKVDVDATQLQTVADLFLEDSTLQTTKWHLALPAQVTADDIKVKAPPGLTYDLAAPDKNKPYWTLDTSASTAERWQVTVTQHRPRPGLGTTIPVGPFHVLGARQQQGTIQVVMPAEFNLGQRIGATRFGQVFQVANTETELAFKYTAPFVSEKNVKGMQAIKAPVELEWRLEKNQVEARVEHTLKLVAGAVRTQAEVGNERGLGNEWEVHATTRMHLTALFGVIPFVDLKLPTNNLRGIAVVGSAAPMLNFPGGVSWSGLWTASGPPMLGHADDVVIVDEKGNPLKVGPTDAVGRTRVFLKDAKQATLVLKSIYRALGPNRRMYVSLPRPLNTLERAGRVFVQADKHIELLTGPEGAEELAPERHQWEQISPQAPAAAEFAWRPHHHEITAQAELDIVLHDHSAEVSETLRFSREAIAGDLVPKLTLGTRTSAIVLHRPHGVDNVKLLSGGVLVSDDSERHTLRVHPDGGDDRVVLKFTFDVAIREGQLVMHALWPVRAAQNEAKVRLFAASGLQARLAPELAERGLWKERSIEIVPGKDQFPSLVLHGAGSSLPLTLNVKEITTASSAAFFAERALIQARVQENGGQHYRALYYLGKIHAQHVDIALPLPESRLRERPAIFLGGRMLTYDRVDADGKVIRVKLHPSLVTLPEILEITYATPESADGASYWRTTLEAPVLRTVVIGQMRWQLTTRTPMLAAVAGRHVRPEVRWTLNGWLPTPEPAVTSADGEAWLAGRERVPSPTPVTMAYTHISFEPETVYHLPRHWWLLGCSGLFLILALGSYLAPLPRLVCLIVLTTVAAGVLGIGIFAPAFFAPVVFGLQPGVLLFALFAGGHWLVQARYRRQLVFMTGFSQPKPGSTLVRGEGSKRGREPSTVDAPGSAPASAAPAGPVVGDQ